VNASPWRGELWLARDFALLHGPAATTRHAHYAHQLMLSPSTPVSVEIDARRVSDHCVLIESMRPHAVHESPPDLYTLFAEPLALAAPALLACARITPLSPSAVIQTLRGVPREPPPDSRVVAALAEVDALLREKIDAQALAQRVQLSLSHLERLFGAQVGLPVRRLVRWRRLRLALFLALSGQSLTSAAHTAGFADSAHFSRTMREMFGVRADATVRGLKVRLID
jgi:AraC-like DNA-binding protein